METAFSNQDRLSSLRLGLRTEGLIKSMQTMVTVDSNKLGPLSCV